MKENREMISLILYSGRKYSIFKLTWGSLFAAHVFQVDDLFSNIFLHVIGWNMVLFTCDGTPSYAGGEGAGTRVGRGRVRGGLFDAVLFLAEQHNE